MAEVSFKELERKANYIYCLYLKAIIADSFGVKRNLEVGFDEKREFTAKKLIEIMKMILDWMPKNYVFILDKELFHKGESKNVWYSLYVSRSTYYRQKRKAFALFISFFEA